MQQRKREEDREERIARAILVDRYGEKERAAAWYNYLTDTLAFPFTAVAVPSAPSRPSRLGTKWT